MQARIQGILARTAQPNPVAEDEARRLGERGGEFSDAERERLKSDPSLTHGQAVENLRAAFPDAEFRTRLKTDDGRWVDPATGIVTDTFMG